MRWTLVAVAALFLTAGLSGCASNNPSTESVSTTTTSALNATASNLPPTALLVLAAENNLTLENGTFNVTAPANVTFDLDGVDPEGRDLTWTVTVVPSLDSNATTNTTDGDASEGNSTDGNSSDGNATADVNATAAGNTTPLQGDRLPANVTITFEQEGRFAIWLEVSDGNLSTMAKLDALVLPVLPTGPVLPTTPLHVDDDAGDSTTPVTDLLWFEASIVAGDDPAAAALQVVLQVDTLYPTSAALTPVSYSAIVNGVQFDSFARYPIDSNPMTWDGAAYTPAGTSRWDTGANQVTFTFPLAWLEETYDVAYPFQLSAKANFGGLLVTDEDDAAPDSGTVPY